MEAPFGGILRKLGLTKKPSNALVPAAPATAAKQTEEIPTPTAETVSSPAKELPKPNPTAIMTRAVEAMEKISDVIVIPAAPGNEEVRILAHPAYHRINHGQRMMKYVEGSDGLTHPMEYWANPTYYASYLVQMGSEPGLRLITLPVATYPGRETYNQEITGEMLQQGFAQEEIRQNCPQRRVLDTANRVDINLFPVLRGLLKFRNFVTQKPNPEAPEITLKSGWDPNQREIVVIDNTTPKWDGVYNYFQRTDREKTLMGGGIYVISQPFTMNSIGEYEARIVERILRFNKDNLSNAKPNPSPSSLIKAQ